MAMDGESYLDLDREIADLKAEIKALSKDTESRMNYALEKISRKSKANLEILKQKVLESIERGKTAKLDSENEILREQLRKEQLLTSIKAEGLNKSTKATLTAANRILSTQLQNATILNSILSEQALRRDKTWQKYTSAQLTNAVNNARLQQEQALNSIKLEQVKRTETIDGLTVLEYQAETEKQQLRLQNEQTISAMQIEGLNQNAKAEKMARAAILAIRLHNVQIETKIKAEQLEREEHAQVLSAQKILDLKLKHEELLTQIREAGLDVYEKAVIRTQVQLDQAQLDHAEAEAAIQTATVNRLKLAQVAVNKQVDDLRTAFEQLQGELLTADLLKGSNAILQRVQNDVVSSEVAYSKKLADLRTSIGKISTVDMVDVVKRDEHGNVQYKTETDKNGVEHTVVETEKVSAAWAFAASAARDAIVDSQLKIQEVQAEINKWNALHSKEFEGTYLAAEGRLRALDAKIKFEKEYGERLLAAGVTSDSQTGQNIKYKTEQEQTRATNKANTEQMMNDIFASGLTIKERLTAFADTRKGASIDKFTGERYDKKSAKQDFQSAKTAAGFSGSYKEFKKDVYKKLNDTAASRDGGKSGKQLLEEYLDAKAAYEGAGEGDDAEALKRAMEDALGNTGLTENEATAAEASEKSKQATVNGWANATAILANIAQKLDGLMDEIALNQAKIDTRLYGSKQNQKLMGSYWKQMSFDLGAAMISPFIRQETLTNNILKVVDMGIARDATQMAMLETLKEKIVTTFNTFDGTMLRLIKIQDNNTTAARMGMEASLTELLNQMYETTQYLTDLAGTVRTHLEEAEALMSGENAVDFEYQVQKWLGSLSSVGMSSTGITSIAEAIGKLAAGDIEGIINGGAGNLMIMAANNANLSISDILADGLDSSEVNVLLNQMVGYMYDLVTESNNNLVVQQQLAKVFGMTASDLRAATNLIYEYNGQSNQMKTLFNKGGTDIYNSMLSTLFNRADSMWKRTSFGEMLQNVWNNVQYSTAAGEVANAPLYLINKTADLLDTFAGGIPIPAISVFGSGVDTKLTVANIIKAIALVGGFTTSLVSMIGSLVTSGGSGFGSGLLKMVGVQGKVTRGADTSKSGTATVYNASVEDTTESATNEGKDSAKEQSVQAKEESSEVSNETINESIVNIYNLLQSVTEGKAALSVKITEQPIGVANDNDHWAWPPSATAVPGMQGV